MHGFLDRDDIARWDRWAMLMFGPPVMEGTVWSEVGALFWGWGLTECVRNIRPKNDKVFNSRSSIEDTSTGVVNAIGICMPEDADIAVTGGTIHRAPSFLAEVKDLLDICPDKTKCVRFGGGCIVGDIGGRRDRVDVNWFTEHVLLLVLIKLEEF